jgi:hypothetical protein
MFSGVLWSARGVARLYSWVLLWRGVAEEVGARGGAGRRQGVGRWKVFRVAFVRRPVLDRARGGVGELTKTCPGLSGHGQDGVPFSVSPHAL